jgi:hypothetical protein
MVQPAIRVVIGSVAAAVAMMLVALLFFATPLRGLAYGSLDEAQSARVQLSLAQNIRETGTYAVPDAGTREGAVAYGNGPVAIVHYNMAGFSPTRASAFLPGFIHMLAAALLIGFALHAIGGRVPEFARRARLVVLFALGASAYVHLAEPIWDHVDWGYAIWLFLGDAAALAVGGLIIARWFLQAPAVVHPHATAAGTTYAP